MCVSRDSAEVAVGVNIKGVPRHAADGEGTWICGRARQGRGGGFVSLHKTMSPQRDRKTENKAENLICRDQLHQAGGFQLPLLPGRRGKRPIHGGSLPAITASSLGMG